MPVGCGDKLVQYGFCRLSSWQILNEVLLRGDDVRTDGVRKTGTYVPAFKQEK